MSWFHHHYDCGHCGGGRGAGRFVLHVLMGLAAAAVLIVGVGWVVMTSWNAVIPDIASLPALTFGQAVALLILARVLVGRFHHGHRRGWHGFRDKSFRDWWQAEGEAAYHAYKVRQGGDSTP